TAVWRPGTGAQHWSAGLTFDEFKQKDAGFFQQGLRLTIVDKYPTGDGIRYLGVWRPGTGEQRWWTGKFADFKAVDQQHFEDGLRVTATNHSWGMMAVWRPGSGAQFWGSGPAADFKAVDQQHFDSGLRLIALSAGFTL